MPGTVRIRWTAPLPAGRLARLYEANAAGLLDDELLDDVGWRLWERLRDVVRVSAGRVRCPSCSVEFQVRANGRPIDDPVPCPTCEWSVTTRAWHASWEHRGLNGHSPAFTDYVSRWPSGGSIAARMALIDGVVHALHVSAREDTPGNFAARNFLEGSRPKIVALLDDLAHGSGSVVAIGARERYQVARDRYWLPKWDNARHGREEGQACS